MKIAGLVVLYNPKTDVLHNIETYLNQVDILYVVDNSEYKNSSFIDTLCISNRIRYIDNQGNQGIASALNTGAILAIKDGYDYLLTMDQDSRASKYMIEKMLIYVEEHPYEKLGIITPYQKQNNESMRYISSPFEEMMLVMTSGNLLNLEAYKHIGRFLDKFFMDQVDLEYCFRLRKHGYKIIRANQVILYHNLGTPIEVAGKIKSIHDYKRIYYIVRNFLYMKKMYEDSFPEYVSYWTSITYDNIKDNLIYGEKRILQILYIVRGYCDYKRNRFGPINNFNRRDFK